MFQQVIVSLVGFQTFFWTINAVAGGTLEIPQMLIFNGVFSGWLAMEAHRVRLSHKENSKTFGVFSRMFLLLSFLSVAIGIIDRSTATDSFGILLPSVTFLPGIGLIALGVYLRHVSIKTLGKFFVTKVQVTNDHRLIKDGIYSLLRHPSYTGLIIGFLGSTLALGSGISLAIFVFAGLPAYFYRIRVEEQALISVFGEEYLKYKSDTYAIFPFVY